MSLLADLKQRMAEPRNVVLTPAQADRFAAQMRAVTEEQMDMEAYDAWVQALDPQDRAAYRAWLIRLTAGQYPELAAVVRAALGAR